MPPVLCTSKDLAGLLSASYEDILTWTRQGEIPAIKVNGRYFYNLSEVIRALRPADEREPVGGAMK